jgi:hypothetical protein
LTGTIFRVAYDSNANLAYGLDATNKKLAKIDLLSGAVTYVDVSHVPNDGCVDPKRGRLFVVNKDGSNTITEYRADDLTSIRDMLWTPNDIAGPMGMQPGAHYQIYCAIDRLYAVDIGSMLFTVDGLDSSAPVVTQTTVPAVGSLAYNAAATDLYDWFGSWASHGFPSGAVHILASDFTVVDRLPNNVDTLATYPPDPPALLDETRGLLIAKHQILDAANLSHIVHTLPGTFTFPIGNSENAFALDTKRGRLAAMSSSLYAIPQYTVVYEMAQFTEVARTTTRPDQIFFDTFGALWALSTAQGTLSSQIVP